MEFDATIPFSQPPLTQGSLWMMKLRSSETMEYGPYPQRPGEPDCSYYIRTGLCRFGATCRFNHPTNRKLAIATARMIGEFPERIGQPECQYYLKTGTCKFGATCKFHHPRDQAGIAGRVALNSLGYPLRPNEPECTYYLRTGQCKFGNTCKFHHPQPSNMMLSLRGSPVYPTVHSPTTPGQQSYAGGIANWSRASYVPSPRWQGPSSYTPLILPQGVVSVPGWSAYNGQMGSISTPDSPQQSMGNSQAYGTPRQGELENAGSHGPYSQFRAGTIPVGFYALQRENIFPERPGQPECQFYMKTGDCKFGAVCRFHHPRERLIPAPDCVLSPLGLPLRPTFVVVDSISKKSCFYGIFPAALLIFIILIFTTSLYSQTYKQKLSSWRLNLGGSDCKKQCRPSGSEALPAGIVSNTSSLQMRALYDPPKRKGNRAVVNIKVNASTNLFAMAVGIKQRDLVTKMVKKFLDSNFIVMLFHYDGIVDAWKNFEWSDRVIHISAINQSKWWFAKRFLHPDIVAEYDYIFLWDEDLGVEDFNPDNYVSIIKEEGLEISQPALDPNKSEVHHQITARGRRSKVHRRTYKASNDGKGCDNSSTAPPCTGWIEMMAPVFSKAAWRCVWYMIQNDLIHAWGLDMQLGYCAQGDRTKNVGVVDAEYVVHYNRPTLGGTEKTTVTRSKEKTHRADVRRLSYKELDIFQKRWEKAVEEDECWVDPFQ